MRTKAGVTSWYLHPRGRWFAKAMAPERRSAELYMTWSAFADEFGHGHPTTVIAGSWAAIVHGTYQSAGALPTLREAEIALRGGCVGEEAVYALVCNLAAQGFTYCCLDCVAASDLALTKMEEAVALAFECRSVHPMDVLRIVEALAKLRNGARRRADAIGLLYHVRDGLAQQFARFPNECYDILGLWVEYVGDQQLEQRTSFHSERWPRDAAVVASLSRLVRSARRAGKSGHGARAQRHFEAAALMLMNNPQLAAPTSARLAAMLACQAASQHPTQRFRVVRPAPRPGEAVGSS